MRYLFPVTFLAILCFSCKKDVQKKPVDNNTSNNIGQEYKINFAIGNAEAGIKTNSKLQLNDATLLTSYFKYLNYLVYDSNGDLVHRIVQQRDSVTNFGLIADYLKAGSYTIIFEAGQFDLMPTTVIPASFAKLSTANIQNPMYHDDFFYKKLNITVTDTSVTQSVTLKRVASKLQIRFSDTIPSDVTGVLISVSAYAYYYSLAKDSLFYGNGSATRISFTPAQIGHANVTVTSALVFAYGPGSVSIRVETAANSMNKYMGASVDDVTFVRNETTLLSGQVFNNYSTSQNGNITISINPDWDGSTTIPF